MLEGVWEMARLLPWQRQGALSQPFYPPEPPTPWSIPGNYPSSRPGAAGGPQAGTRDVRSSNGALQGLPGKQPGPCYRIIPLKMTYSRKRLFDTQPHP